MSRALGLAVAAFVLLAAPGKALAAKPSKVVGSCNWVAENADTNELKRLLKTAGFKAPPDFRALIVKTTLTKNGRGIATQRVYAWDDRAFEFQGWNPASTVKLYSAIGALERVRELGFGPDAKITFHYARGDQVFTLTDLMEAAVHWSDNLPHNRLVQLAGFDRLNGKVLKRLGIRDSYVMRAYQLTDWLAEGHDRSLRDAPAISLREGRKKKELPASHGTGKYPCEGAACTSLSDLAKTMCVMMLHEQLPPKRRLRLGGEGQSAHLKLLRLSMDRKRKGTDDPVWDAFEAAFPAPKYRLFRKAGYSQGWQSENLYVYAPGTRVRWLVTLAATGDRSALTGAAKAVAALLSKAGL
jgi:hypothetical protein